jgi:hypothetical protein
LRYASPAAFASGQQDGAATSFFTSSIASCFVMRKSSLSYIGVLNNYKMKSISHFLSFEVISCSHFAGIVSLVSERYTYKKH